MRITKPSCYDTFRCIAGLCPDSCCKEWEIAVDPEAARRYLELSGPLGQRLRQVLRREDDLILMTIENGRCPMWRADGLCRIHAELGEEALCETCHDFPRLTHDYGDFVELGLELSCPEAARLLLTQDHTLVDAQTLQTGEGEYDTEAMEVLLATRQKALALLEDTSRPVREVLAILLLYGCQAQGQLDGEEEAPFDAASAVETAYSLAGNGSAEEVLAFFRELEILGDPWAARLAAPAPGSWQEAQTRRLARYFVERYWLQAVSDYDLYCRVKMLIIACLTVRLLGGDFCATAQRWSKEIENNSENMDALLDAAYAHRAFTDDRLLGLLLTD